MPIRTGGPAPYAPPGAVLQLIGGFRDRGLTTPITSDVLMRAGVSESLVPRTLRTLEGLELIDTEGNPTPEMEGLRRVSSEEFKHRLEAIVKSVYAEVFQFTDPATDGAEKIADAFRAYEPIGQRGRMVTLFLGLCEAAGIIAEGTARKQAPSGNGVKRASKTGSGRKADASYRPASVSAAKAQLRNAADGMIPLPISGVLSKLPSEGTGWTKDQRATFLKAFEAMLDFSIPIVERVAADEEEE